MVRSTRGHRATGSTARPRLPATACTWSATAAGTRSGDRERVAVRWFADSTCPTCRIALFHVWRAEGGVRDRSHTHTQDELILLLGGNVIVAGEEHGVGTCLAIPAFGRGIRC